MVQKRAHKSVETSGSGHDEASRTVSIALPSSILQNAQSAELQMYVAGQVARAAAIYRVNEIVIFTEQGAAPRSRRGPSLDAEAATEFFSMILRYVETPQYLRKHLFPVTPQLRLVGLLNPLALPSHVSRTEYSRWREGVGVGRHTMPAHQTQKHGLPPTRYVDVGLERFVEVDRAVGINTRVTVDMTPSGDDESYSKCPGKHLYGRVVDRDSPAQIDGTYFGYHVRTAGTLAGVFYGSEICDQYDLVVGTSERGVVLGDEDGLRALPRYQHALIVFGGVHGLEHAASSDEEIGKAGVEDVGDLFDFYINTCDKQGSRTIRTEEAVLISLAVLSPYLGIR